MSRRIAVVGSGNIGCAVAADLTLAGHEVVLYEMSEFSENLDPIIQCGGITLLGVGKTGFAKIDKVTTDIAEAIKDTRIIVVATISSVHDTIAELCAPYLEDGQTIILLAAQLGSFEFRKILKEKRPDLQVKIAETNLPLYAARRGALSKAEVTIRVRFREIGLAALPGSCTEGVLDEISEFYPEVFVGGSNVVEVGLSNVNILLHPAPILMMAGWIESSRSNVVWWDGLTPSVLRVVEATFRERNAVFKALGLRDLYSFERLKEELIANPQTKGLTGPPNLHHRFITEDCPMGLVALTSIGDVLGVPTPICKAIITLLSEIIGIDYFNKGRNVERLGISGLSIDKFRELLNKG